MVHMVLICNTKNWKEKEGRPDDVRDSFHGNMCNVMCEVGSTQNTGLAIETLEGTKAGVDSGGFPPIPAPWGRSAPYSQPCGGQGGAGGQEVHSAGRRGSGRLCTCAARLSTARTLLCVVPDNTLGTRWRQQTFPLELLDRCSAGFS